MLAIGAGSYAWVQSNEAERQRGQAESQSRLAIARYLAGETRRHLHDQLDLSLLLGLEARRLADTDEVKSSLVDALLANPFLAAYSIGTVVPDTGEFASNIANAAAAVAATGQTWIAVAAAIERIRLGAKRAVARAADAAAIDAVVVGLHWPQP